MKLKLRIATVCFFLTVAGLSLAAAQQPVPADENGGFEGRWWASPRAQARLGLSAEQTKQIEELTYQSGQRLIDCGAALSKARARAALTFTPLQTPARLLDRDYFLGDKVASAYAGQTFTHQVWATAYTFTPRDGEQIAITLRDY